MKVYRYCSGQLEIREVAGDAVDKLPIDTLAERWFLSPQALTRHLRETADRTQVLRDELRERWESTEKALAERRADLAKVEEALACVST